MEDNSPLENDELSEYDIYGKTPPRTKILRKNRERKQRDKQMSLPLSTGKFVRANPVFNRRNTVSSFYQDALKDDREHDLNEGTKRCNKRHMKLLRGTERDLKLDIASAQARSTEKAKKNQDDMDYPRTPSYQIESSKRFMSLMCRTYPCNKLKNVAKLQESDVTSGTNESICDENEEGGVVSDECTHARVEFYHTLKVLIRMGSGDKSSDRIPRRGMSKEETLWQNELKDVIWLELQAYHAERTPMDEDAYLCSARDIVEPLLDDIKNYRFRRHLKERRYLTENSDSGMEEDCAGCLSIYCLCCMEAQNEALRDVENLLKRLEDAESLFPSSKAFAELYPLYSSVEIVGRVKAMCLWYNMTKHQRLKLNILGRLLTLVDNKHGNWSVLSDDSSCSGSPSDSNNSTHSSSSDIGRNADYINVTPIAAFLSRKDENKVSPYRRYIENVLKTRALDKSLNFLRRLHENVLIKTQLTLDMPNDESIFSKNSVESEEEELRRYGSWSPEAKTLHLPSYRSMFIFLSMVPLEVVHEYLLMRLEQKPENPSPLSIRQLMRELKDGLRVAIEERVRCFGYIESATYGTNNVVENCMERVQSVDECISRVFTDYLDYLQQWVLLHKNTFQKNLLEEEYKFSCYVCKFVPDGKNLMGSRFSFILGTILQCIGDRLILRIEEVLQPLSNIEEGMIKQNLFSVCRQLQSLFNEEREMSLKAMAFFKMNLKYDSVPSKCLNCLVVSIIAFKCIIPNAIAKVQGLFDHDSITSLDDIDRNAVNTRIREILMQVYRFGFDFYKEMSDSTPVKFRCRLVESMIDFANLWMKFVTERCERGRGMRPRWAYQGMEFLLTVCEPENTRHLTEEKFDNLKKDMDVCISHVIGTTAPSTPDSGFHTPSPKTSLEQIRARSRGSSPIPRPTYKSQRSGNNRKLSVEQQSPGADTLESANSTPSLRNSESPRLTTVKIKFPPKTHSEHWREALEALEIDIDSKLRKQKLIGKVLHDRTSNKNVHRRNVTFSWQRGIKIGQGRFGKVYTAVNNNTGDMMAVKEIALQHNDSVTIKRIAEEMKILEGIVHKNLLKYYGVEVHKDEMLIFMEYCSEGTLENLIAATERGLPELLVRRYTFQLVSGVGCLHHHGIVHRDIKTANIFLTNEGNCLKIGDFGCAAKIMANTTMPGELKGFVGTQAYMAPEVFTKNMSEGHGRAADIWSVGCVVVEMASGERPWAQYDSNYQIMFKVGMGQSPDPPDDMIDEGLDFLDMCFRHDPKERATARELLTHNFVKAGEDLN